MNLTRENIDGILIEILEEMIELYELPPTAVDQNTQLIGTLGFSSVDIMHLLATADMRFQIHVPYEDLVMKDGEPVTEFTVGQIGEYIFQNIEKASSEPQNMAE